MEIRSSLLVRVEGSTTPRTVHSTVIVGMSWLCSRLILSVPSPSWSLNPGIPGSSIVDGESRCFGFGSGLRSRKPFKYQVKFVKSWQFCTKQINTQTICIMMTDWHDKIKLGLLSLRVGVLESGENCWMQCRRQRGGNVGGSVGGTEKSYHYA